MVELLLTVTLISTESIHAQFNWIEMQYNGIVNPLDRLRYVFNEHNVESTPGLNTLRLEPRNYRKPPRDDTS